MKRAIPIFLVFILSCQSRMNKMEKEKLTLTEQIRNNRLLMESNDRAFRAFFDSGNKISADSCMKLYDSLFKENKSLLRQSMDLDRKIREGKVSR
jgi:hypothetical protein